MSPTPPATPSGFTLYPAPPARLTGRSYLEENSPVASNTVDEMTARLELQNMHLRQQNKVLRKQNLDYRELIDTYRECYNKGNESLEHSRAVLNAIERIAEIVRADISSYEAAKGDVRRAERSAARDWKRFAIENASIGIDVDEVVKNIDTMEITIYPYRADPDMI
jgi:hypothetical protein